MGFLFTTFLITLVNRLCKLLMIRILKNSEDLFALKEQYFNNRGRSSRLLMAVITAPNGVE